ncbi:IclR family transcriptional regulator [Microbacterium protaetiae]|uniref:IclR family transcriptional regulator n=1 Tax=Microbacterium protaetiae TaxID=2509458 RepID=A0A4V0YD67_9MICO|nr:IclR family transcriptional regulator [Microbacterium protaetiae]QAY59651.1 IclR family transcriptional regulator [Microbacterium protaetiae]
MTERKPIKVLANSMAIIDGLAERGDLSPADLAHLTGLPRPSVYRLIDGLRVIGLVRSTDVSVASLSVKWLHLADAARASMSEWAGARTELDRLSAETEQTVFLAVPRGDEVVCIDQSLGRGVGMLILSPGRSLPLYAGGVGRLALAHLADLDRYLSSGPPRRRITPHTLTDAAELREDAERTRSQGYTLSLDDVTVGIGAVAVPVLAPDGSLLGCLSVAGRTAEISAQAESFVAAAREVASQLATTAARVLSGARG